MGDRKTNMMIANLASRKESLQTQVNKKKEDISKIEEDISKLNEQIDKINTDISKIQMRAEKESGNEPDELADTTVQGDESQSLETEEADAATTIGSLDASSSGDFGGWRHYGKIGDTASRFSGKRKKKKNKREKILSYINKVFDPDTNNDGSYDASDFN